MRLLVAASMLMKQAVGAFIVVERAALRLQEEISRRANQIFNYMSCYLKAQTQTPSKHHGITQEQVKAISREVTRLFQANKITDASKKALIVTAEIIDDLGNVCFKSSQEYQENPEIEGPIHAIFLGSEIKGITILDDPFTLQQKKLIHNTISSANYFFTMDTCPYMGTHKRITSHENMVKQGLWEVKSLVYTRKFVENPPEFIDELPDSITTITKSFFKMLNFTKSSGENGEWELTSDCLF